MHNAINESFHYMRVHINRATPKQLIELQLLQEINLKYRISIHAESQNNNHNPLKHLCLHDGQWTNCTASLYFIPYVFSSINFFLGPWASWLPFVWYGSSNCDIVILFYFLKSKRNGFLQVSFLVQKVRSWRRFFQNN